MSTSCSDTDNTHRLLRTPSPPPLIFERRSSWELSSRLRNVSSTTRWWSCRDEQSNGSGSQTTRLRRDEDARVTSADTSVGVCVTRGVKGLNEPQMRDEWWKLRTDRHQRRRCLSRSALTPSPFGVFAPLKPLTATELGQFDGGNRKCFYVNLT